MFRRTFLKAAVGSLVAFLWRGESQGESQEQAPPNGLTPRGLRSYWYSTRSWVGSDGLGKFSVEIHAQLSPGISQEDLAAVRRWAVTEAQDRAKHFRRMEVLQHEVYGHSLRVFCQFGEGFPSARLSENTPIR